MFKRIGYACLGAVLLSSIAQAAPFQLRSHEATYAMKQSHQNGQSWSGVEQADGVLQYRFQNVCDGWTVEHQSAIQMALEDESTANMAWNYTSWEAKDGSRLRFHTRMRENGELSDSFSGEARLEEGKGVIVYSEPNGRREELPAHTRFPTTHLIESLQRAQKGEVVFSAPYFDGSGEETAFDVDVVMTPYKGKPLSKVEESELPSSPTWDMKIAFFDPGTQNSIAETNIGARYRLDGLATRLVQDFGDLVLVGQLVELKYLDEPNCD